MPHVQPARRLSPPGLSLRLHQDSHPSSNSTVKKQKRCSVCSALSCLKSAKTKTVAAAELNGNLTFLLSRTNTQTTFAETPSCLSIPQLIAEQLIPLSTDTTGCSQFCRIRDNRSAARPTHSTACRLTAVISPLHIPQFSTAAWLLPHRGTTHATDRSKDPHRPAHRSCRMHQAVCVGMPIRPAAPKLPPALTQCRGCNARKQPAGRISQKSLCIFFIFGGNQSSALLSKEGHLETRHRNRHPNTKLLLHSKQNIYIFI